jgi:hypothetical protein
VPGREDVSESVPVSSVIDPWERDASGSGSITTMGDGTWRPRDMAGSILDLHMIRVMDREAVSPFSPSEARFASHLQMAGGVPAYPCTAPRLAQMLGADTHAEHSKLDRRAEERRLKRMRQCRV